MNEAGGRGVDVTDCIFPRRNISSNIQFAVLVMRGMDMMKSILNDFFQYGDAVDDDVLKTPYIVMKQ